MFARKDGILIAIAILVLVLGTATGSAYAMLAMAAAGLALSAVLYGRNLGGRANVVVLTAALAAFAVGFALTMR